MAENEKSMICTIYKSRYNLLQWRRKWCPITSKDVTSKHNARMSHPSMDVTSQACHTLAAQHYYWVMKAIGAPIVLIYLIMRIVWHAFVNFKCAKPWDGDLEAINMIH